MASISNGKQEADGNGEQNSLKKRMGKANARKQDKEPLRTYKCRGEAIPDSNKAKILLIRYTWFAGYLIAKLICETQNIGAEFNVHDTMTITTNMPLEKMQKFFLFLRCDLHVMAETLKPIEEYDGQRQDFPQNFEQLAITDEDFAAFVAAEQNNQ